MSFPGCINASGKYAYGQLMICVKSVKKFLK